MAHVDVPEIPRADPPAATEDPTINDTPPDGWVWFLGWIPGWPTYYSPTKSIGAEG